MLFACSIFFDIKLWNNIFFGSVRKLFLLKYLLPAIVTMMVFSTFIFFGNTNPLEKTKLAVSNSFVKKETLLKETIVLKTYADKIRSYIKKNNYCKDYCFMINMKMSSGKKRFFIYDLRNDSIIDAGLVTHGGGSETGTDKLVFSNVPNSSATSLGKYKIGREYSGKFGMAFKLHGLEISNSKALERFVVLHAHSCVPKDEVSPLFICTSLGCPTVNPAFLQILKKYIDQSNKPVLLWIYY